MLTKLVVLLAITIICIQGLPISSSYPGSDANIGFDPLKLVAQKINWFPIPGVIEYFKPRKNNTHNTIVLHDGPRVTIIY